MILWYDTKSEITKQKFSDGLVGGCIFFRIEPSHKRKTRPYKLTTELPFISRKGDIVKGYIIAYCISFPAAKRRAEAEFEKWLEKTRLQVKFWKEL